MGVAVRDGRQGVCWSPLASAAFAKIKWPMKARREEEVIIALATRSRVFGGEGFSVLVQVASGPMQGHSSLDVELRRVFNLAQSVACLLVKAEKLVCCLMKSIRQQSNYKLDENNH